MNTNRAPFTTAELMQLPRNAYAFRNRHGVWGIRQDTQTVNATIANGNSETLTASDYYATPVDALIVAEVVARSFTVAKQIEMAYNG